MTRKALRKRRQEQEKRKKHDQTQATPRGSLPWVAMGALVASTALGGVNVTPAYARELDGVQLALASRHHVFSVRHFHKGSDPLDPRLTVIEDAIRRRTAMPAELSGTVASQSGSTSPQDQPARRFDIPPGPLGTVLAAFETATGVRVVVTVDVVRPLYSPGASGVYTIDQALQQLLSGIGVSYRFTDPRTVTLELRVASESVDVSAHAPALASPKYAESLRDTPQSIDVVPRQIIEDQGATTLRDTVRNVAGISLAAGEGGAQGDSLTIRGFTARNDIFIDGMRDFGSYYRDSFNEEQVQVLKGPSSVTFGRGSTGGVVNQATKAPQLDRFLAGTATFGTDETRRVTLDLNQPVPTLGKGAAIRLNMMGTDAHVAGREIARNRRWGIAPSLALGLGTPTRLTLNYFHQSGDDIPDYGIPWLLNAPAPVPRRNYYGFKDANFLQTRADIGTARFEHEVGSAVTLTNQVRYASYRRDVQITEARLTGTFTRTTPLGAIAINRGQIAVNSVETFFQNQFDVTTRFHTGGVQHVLVTGVEAGRETSDPTRPGFTGVPGTNLLNPDTTQLFAGSSTITSRVQASAVSFGVYALDTLSLGEKWDLTGGTRWDRFDANHQQFVAPVSAFNRVDATPSWRGAAVYKPRPIGSIYFGYGTSFNPSAESLSLSASNANTPPETNKTYELGSKWDLSPRKLSIRAALFRTEKTNAREPDPSNPLQNVLSGKQRVDGFEAETTGRMTARWEMRASYALMNSELVKSNFFPKAVGGRLANVPKHTFSVWNTYEFPWHFEIGGGGQYVGTRTASSTAPIDPTTGLVKALPGYWVMNAMTKARLTDRLNLQLNVNNLTDKYYFDQAHPGHTVPGPGRSALLGFNFTF